MEKDNRFQGMTEEEIQGYFDSLNYDWERKNDYLDLLSRSKKDCKKESCFEEGEECPWFNKCHPTL